MDAAAAPKRIMRYVGVTCLSSIVEREGREGTDEPEKGGGSGCEGGCSSSRCQIHNLGWGKPCPSTSLSPVSGSKEIKSLES